MKEKRYLQCGQCAIEDGVPPQASETKGASPDGVPNRCGCRRLPFCNTPAQMTDMHTGPSPPAHTKGTRPGNLFSGSRKCLGKKEWRLCNPKVQCYMDQRHGSCVIPPLCPDGDLYMQCISMSGANVKLHKPCKGKRRHVSAVNECYTIHERRCEDEQVSGSAPYLLVVLTTADRAARLPLALYRWHRQDVSLTLSRPGAVSPGRPKHKTGGGLC